MSPAKIHGARLFAAAAAVLAGCGTTEVASHWRESGAVLSGSGSGWPSSATVFEDRRMSAAVFNDSEYVYVGLRTTNVDVQRLLLRRGITVWFDNQGGAKKSFGIHYPLTPQAPRFRDEGEDIPPQMEREDLTKVPRELELFTSENVHQRMSILAAGGIEPRIHRQRDTLVYELRVPLTPDATHPFGIGAHRGAVIGLGAVTPDISVAPDISVDRPEGEGEPEGGFGGRRSGGGRGAGGARPDAAVYRAGEVSIWMKVRLAPGGGGGLFHIGCGWPAGENGKRAESCPAGAC